MQENHLKMQKSSGVNGLSHWRCLLHLLILKIVRDVKEQDHCSIRGHSPWHMVWHFQFFDSLNYISWDGWVTVTSKWTDGSSQRHLYELTSNFIGNTMESGHMCCRHLSATSIINNVSVMLTDLYIIPDSLQQVLLDFISNTKLCIVFCEIIVLKCWIFLCLKMLFEHSVNNNTE